MLRNQNHSPVQSLTPAVRTANVNGTSTDLSGFDSATVTFLVGALTDGTHTPAVEESANNSSFTPVAAGDLVGTLAALTASTMQKVAYIGSKRYIRAQVNSSGATGCAYGAVISRGHDWTNDA